MTGPDIHRLRPGDNAIGRFVIGVSPIGSIAPHFDFWRTVISQYANSPIMTGLIEDFSEYIDPTVNLDSFFDNAWNVDTAVEWGLDRIGRVVGVGRTLELVGDQIYFSFQEAGPLNVGTFDEVPFYNGETISSNFELADDAYRILIRAKMLANISDGCIPSLNQLLLILFPGRGNCYVADGLNMTMAYTFEFTLTPVELAIVEQSGVLPRSTGVSQTVVQA